MFNRRWHWWLLGLLILVVVGGVLINQRDNLLARLPFLSRDRTWEAIQQRGVWRVALDPSFPPFESLNEQGQMVGFDVDLANLLAQQLGVEVQLVAIGFDSLTDAVKTAQVDSVISALSYDPRLTRDFAYSQPYFEAGIRLVVRQQGKTGSGTQAAAINASTIIRSVDELSGKVIAVEMGSMGDAISRQWQRAGKEIEVVRLETPAAAISALSQGVSSSGEQIDALLIDGVSLREAQGKGAPIVVVGPPIEANPYVIAMPRSATELQKRIDVALSLLAQNRKLTQLEEQWFGRIE